MPMLNATEITVGVLKNSEVLKFDILRQSIIKMKERQNV